MFSHFRESFRDSGRKVTLRGLCGGGEAGDGGQVFRAGAAAWNGVWASLLVIPGVITFSVLATGWSMTLAVGSIGLVLFSWEC